MIPGIPWVRVALAAGLFLAGAALVIGIFRTGVNYAERQCRVESVKAERDQLQRDLNAANAAAEQERQAAIDAAADKAAAEERSKALEETIAKLPVGEQCIIPAERARELQPAGRDKPHR